jgi:hypothetical protein
MQVTNMVPSSLWQWLAEIEPDDRFALCVVSIVFGVIALVFTIGLVSHTVHSIHQARLENTLKRELLDRGLSVDEIAKVIAATGTGKRPDCRSQSGS